MLKEKKQLKINNFFKFKLISLFLVCILTTFYILLATSASAWKPGEPIVPCGRNLPGGGQCIENPPGTWECLGGANAGNTCIDDSNCGNQTVCTKCELLHLVKNVIDFIMIAAAPILATVFFVIAGIYLMLGGANPGMLSTGKRMFKDTFIGILIVMLAWLITNTLIQTLVKGGLVGSNGNWWELNCSDVGLGS